jgi:hypothetical protein
MQTKTDSNGLPINMSAWRLATKAGQFVEQLLLEEADELAKSANLPAVTTDHIRASLNQNILDGLRKFLNEQTGDELRRAG